MGLVASVAYSLRAQSEKRKQIIQVGQPFGLAPFSSRQSVAGILFVEQIGQTFLHALGQSKLCQVTRHLHFQLDGLRHIRFLFLRRNLPEQGRNVQTWNHPFVVKIL